MSLLLLLYLHKREIVQSLFFSDCLTYFSQHNAQEVHSCFLKWQDFIPLVTE